MTHQEILAIEFESMDLGRTLSIKEFLLELLKTVWQEGEEFSGKRPFGFSDWRDDLYKPLVKHGLVAGTMHEEGYIEDCDSAAASRLVMDLINAL